MPDTRAVNGAYLTEGAGFRHAAFARGAATAPRTYAGLRDPEDDARRD